MKVIPYFFLCTIPFGVCEAIPDHEDVSATLKPCMNKEYSPEVISCLINLYKNKEKEYISEYRDYLQSVNTSKETSDAKLQIITLEKKAKTGWDIFMANSCLSGVALYEKDSYGYNAKYYICLIENMDVRVKYYRANKF